METVLVVAAMTIYLFLLPGAAFRDAAVCRGGLAAGGGRTPSCNKQPVNTTRRGSWYSTRWTDEEFKEVQ